VNDERPRRRRALRSFVFGSVVGGALAVGAQRLRRGGRGHHGHAPEPIAGLEAFEGAPCWEHDRRPADGEPV
jgi:hypothetical protein